MPVQFQTAIDPSYSPVLYTPDYTFLRYLLDKKTERYNQGLSSVASSYANLQKELSDPTNVERRSQYLKNAEGKLQQLAASDLSLPENVNVAQTLFDPIVTDKAILFDAAATAKNAKERAQMESWRDSEDMEQRKKFNPLIYNWLSRDMDAIKNGNGNIENYKGYEGRTAFGYVDAQDILTKAVKDYGYETKQDIDGGMYVYGVKDGVKFRQSYKTFANEVLASNPVYQRQNQILGKSTYDGVVDEAKKLGIDPKTFTKDYAEKDYTTYRDTRKKYVTEIKDDLDKEKADIFAEGNNLDVSTPEGQQKMQELAAKTAALEEKYKQYNELQYDYNKTFGTTSADFDTKKAEYINNFVNNPEGMFADQYRLQDVNRFSNIKSATVSSTIQQNTAYFAGYNASNEARKTTATILNNINKGETAEAAENRQEKKLNWEMLGKPIMGEEFETVTTYDESGKPTTTKRPKKPEIQYSGGSATDISTRISSLNFLNSQLNLNSQKAIGNLAADPNGGAISIIESLGVKTENVARVREFLMHQHDALTKDPGKPYQATKDEQDAVKDFFRSAFATIKQSGNEEALSKIRGLVGKDINTLDIADVLDLSFKSMKLNGTDYQKWMQLQDYQKAKNNILDISNSINKGNQAVAAMFDNPKEKPDFQGMFYTDAAGKRKLIDETGLVNHFKGFKDNIYQDISWGTDKKVKLEDEDLKNIATGFLNGSIKFTHANKTLTKVPSSTDSPYPFRDDIPKTKFSYKGKDYYVGNNIDGEWFTPYDSKKYLSNLEQINNEQITIPGFSDVDAKSNYFAAPLFYLDGQLKENIVTVLSDPTQFSSYLVQQNAELGYTPVGDPATEDAVRKALKDPKNIVEKGVVVHSKSAANNGGLAVAVTLRNANKGEEGDYWGKEYYFPIDVSQDTPRALATFSTIDDESEYNRIKKAGVPADMYNFERMGLSIKVVPNAKDSPYGRLIVKALKQDPTTKQFMPGVYEEKPIDYNLNTMTYDELKQQVFQQIINPYMTVKIAMDAENEKQSNTPTSTTISMWDAIKKRLNNIK